MGESESAKNIGGPRYINHVAACGSLDWLSMTLNSYRQQQQKQKGCVMVMANPPDLGRGKKT